MELTRFDLENQAIQKRIAGALERIAKALEVLTKSAVSKDAKSETSVGI